MKHKLPLSLGIVTGVMLCLSVVAFAADNTYPTVVCTEDYRPEERRSTIYLNAHDESGIDYVKLPDGSLRRPEPPISGVEQPISLTYEITTNGEHHFEVCDKAGNVTTRTFTYEDLVTDYAAQSIRVVSSGTSGRPFYDTPFEVDVVWQNYSGSGHNIPVELYVNNGGKVYLVQDTISVLQGSQITKRYKINLNKIVGATTLCAEINPLQKSRESNTSNNTTAIGLNIGRIDYGVTAELENKWFSPGQRISVPITITETNVGDAQAVSVDMYLGGSRIHRSFVQVDQYNPSVKYNVTGTVPANTPDTNLSLRIVVNENNVSQESSASNNTYNTTITVHKSNLALKFNSTLITDGDTYSYPSDQETYTVNVTAVDANEKILTYTTLGRTVEVNANSVPVQFKLGKKQSQDIAVTVQSACGKYTAVYYTRILRCNDDAQMDMWYEINGVKTKIDFVQTAGTNGYNATVYVPMNTTSMRLIAQMQDSSGLIRSFHPMSGPQYENKNKIVVPIMLAPNSPGWNGIAEAHAQDNMLYNVYRITVQNKNTVPTVNITNKSEVQNVMYTLGGVLRGSTFTPYGKDITAVELARRTGCTNGLIVEAEVKDSNSDQYLRGYLQIGEKKYAMHFNSITGSTVMQASKISKGYVYIDRSAFNEDFASKNLYLTVQDYMSDNETDTVLSTSANNGNSLLKFGVDITGPQLVGNLDEPSRTLTVTQATDPGTGLLDLQYRVSENRGASWSAYKTFTNSASITGTGTIYVEVLARDRGRNTTTAQYTMNVVGPTVGVADGVYTKATRVADFWYINTRRNNADVISKEVIDAFK